VDTVTVCLTGFQRKLGVSKANPNNFGMKSSTACVGVRYAYLKLCGLARLLHNYRQYSGSQSRKNIDGKILDHHEMSEVYRDFLRAKVGFVSEENEKYIGEVFERSMRRTLQEKSEASASGTVKL
jgi:hypothetical protein